MATPAGGWTAGLSDADVRGAMLAALRLTALLCVVVMAGFWWRMGWGSAALVAIGAVISAASLWEWLRLMTAMNRQMDRATQGGPAARPMGLILTGFFLRLGLTVVVLYGSLRYLHGTAFALLAGLGLGLIALTVEALRLMKRWTV